MSLGPERSDVAAPPAIAGVASEQPTRQLSVAGTSEHCVNCGAPLASDQRYCVNCGERRGKPRFALAAAPEEATPEVATTSSSSSSPRRPRASTGFGLIAGIATLLLAMGVGVLIGHSSSASNTTKQAATPNITINGGGSANGSAGTAASTGATGATGSSGGSTSSTKKSKHGSSAKAAKSSAPSKVVVQKAAAAASKVTGGSANTAGATAQQGSACSNDQAGCQNGKLTGNYFGQ